MQETRLCYLLVYAVRYRRRTNPQTGELVRADTVEAVLIAVGKGIADPSVVDPHVVFGALTGAITWNLITWYYGIPSSSSHALIGGIVGAVIAKAGADALIASGIVRTVAFIFVSPLLGWTQEQLLEHGYRGDRVRLWSHLNRSRDPFVAASVDRLVDLSPRDGGLGSWLGLGKCCGE